MPKIVGPYGPRRTRRASTAKVANQRENRHRESHGAIRRRQHKTEGCGEQHGAVKDQHDLAVSAESREARGQQQQNCKPDRDQEAHAHSSIDHHAGHSASPIAAKAYKQPRAHPLAGHARQDLGEEYADSRHGNRGDNGYPRGADCERIENIAPAHAQKRDLKHDDEHRECRPAKIQQWDARTRAGANRFAGRRTKNTPRSRSASLRRSQVFQSRHRAADLSSQGRWPR